jgi:hypothetical protein
MVAAPILLNILFFWLIDSLIMRRHAHPQPPRQDSAQASAQADAEAKARALGKEKAEKEEEAERVMRDGAGFMTACWPKRRQGAGNASLV